MQDAVVSTLLEIPESLHDAVMNYIEGSGKDYDKTIQQWIALGLLQSLPQNEATKTDRQVASKIYLEGVLQNSDR